MGLAYLRIRPGVVWEVNGAAYLPVPWSVMERTDAAVASHPWVLGTDKLDHHRFYPDIHIASFSQREREREGGREGGKERERELVDPALKHLFLCCLKDNTFAR